MHPPSKKTPILRILIVGLFFLIAIGALAVFGYYIFQLSVNIYEHASFVVFNKGAMYMFGVGSTSGLLTYFLVHEILEKKISPSFNKKASFIGAAFVASIFIIPQLIHYGVQRYINHIKYEYCPEQSDSWLHAQNFVYTSNKNNCLTFNRE